MSSMLGRPEPGSFAGYAGFDAQGKLKPTQPWQTSQAAPETMARDKEMGYPNFYNNMQDPTPITYMGKEMSEPDFKAAQGADLGAAAAVAPPTPQPAAFNRTPTPPLRNMMTQPQAQATPDQAPQNNMLSNALMMLFGGR